MLPDEKPSRLLIIYDGEQRGRQIFRSFVKPVLDAGAIDYKVIDLNAKPKKDKKKTPWEIAEEQRLAQLEAQRLVEESSIDSVSTRIATTPEGGAPPAAEAADNPDAAAKPSTPPPPPPPPPPKCKVARRIGEELRDEEHINGVICISSTVFRDVLNGMADRAADTSKPMVPVGFVPTIHYYGWRRIFGFFQDYAQMRLAGPTALAAVLNKWRPLRLGDFARVDEQADLRRELRMHLAGGDEGQRVLYNPRAVDLRKRLLIFDLEAPVAGEGTGAEHGPLPSNGVPVIPSARPVAVWDFEELARLQEAGYASK
ncbi:hypothetical protein H696_05488 [Fonticula alba]|uniref:Uncharacterized protein n=1 Tax=Fonticula alba TaxID=691883 RepID=A0A058Z1A7_FONAL|nr:hypothetical protein H696_05488 [Fonticula alba]KCV68020.1 hypothetical protein H696_05488 [Fonticula alba]|eukprot:XP_009497587.1 hypothetical protein H696_05488 [Fonticula alba]